MKPLRILSIFGTRPEAIKFAPVIQALHNNPQFESIVGVTGQHREMLDQVMQLANIKADFNLDIMRPDQTLAQLTARVMEQLSPLLQHYQPDRVLVQGDTTTAFATSLACFYAGIKVGHIEAGLRSHNMHSPWPEEFNRRAISLVTDMHFAPTSKAASYLKQEGFDPNSIFLTGNTVVDALHYFSKQLQSDQETSEHLNKKFAHIDPTKKLILVTMHRRESFDGGIENVCQALADIAKLGDVNIVFPVHMNPNVRKPVQHLLANHPAIHLEEPLDYLEFLYLMNRAHCIISDSGGVQEEAPSLQKPLLVIRNTTERPEGVTAGAVKLVGTNTQTIVKEATTLLTNATAYKNMQNGEHLYGDGNAATRIAQRILEHHGYAPRKAPNLFTAYPTSKPQAPRTQPMGYEDLHDIPNILSIRNDEPRPHDHN